MPAQILGEHHHSADLWLIYASDSFPTGCLQSYDAFWGRVCLTCIYLWTDIAWDFSSIKLLQLHLNVNTQNSRKMFTPASCLSCVGRGISCRSTRQVCCDAVLWLVTCICFSRTFLFSADIVIVLKTCSADRWSRISHNAAAVLTGACGCYRNANKE